MASNPVGDASRLDPAGERQAERVDEDVALPALHLLVRVEAARAAALGGFDRLDSSKNGAFEVIPAGAGGFGAGVRRWGRRLELALAVGDGLFDRFVGFVDLWAACRRSGGRGSGLKPGEAE